MTGLIFCNYSVRMDGELKSLEDKVHAFVEHCQQICADNVQLRQQLDSAASQNKQLEAKITAASSRLESLLAQMPESEA